MSVPCKDSWEVAEGEAGQRVRGKVSRWNSERGRSGELKRQSNCQQSTREGETGWWDGGQFRGASPAGL